MDYFLITIKPKYMLFSYTKKENRSKKQLLSFLLVLVLVLAMVVPASASESEWYLEYADTDGIFYNSDCRGGLEVNFSHGLIVVTYTSFYHTCKYDYNNVHEENGVYVYTEEESGSEMRYDPSDGSISMEGDDYIYMPITKHGAQYELLANFDVNWCKTPVLFSKDGWDLTASMDDDGTILFDSDSCRFSVDGSEYEAASSGGVYYTDHDKYEVYYVPEAGILVLLEDGWATVFDKMAESVYSTLNEPVTDPAVYGHYLWDTVAVGSDMDMTVRVFAPYWTQGTDFMGSYINIRVCCQIQNASDDNLVFVASDHFSLNNNGIIEYGSSEYDYTTIAPWTTIRTFIDFKYRMNSVNIDYGLMTMTVDGTDFSLTIRPQSPEQYDSFEGVYYHDNAGSLDAIYVEDLGGGEYNVIETVGATLLSSFNSYYSTQVVMDERNAFTLDGIKYYWNPSEHTIDCPFSGFTYVKQ